MDAADPLQNLLLTDVCATAKLLSQRSQLIHVMPRCKLHSRCAGSHEDARRNALLHSSALGRQAIRTPGQGVLSLLGKMYEHMSSSKIVRAWTSLSIRSTFS